MTDYQRIESVLKYLGMSARAFSIALGLSSPQIFYDIKAGKCGISKDLSNKIQEHYLNINPAWLLTGEGDMLRNVESRNEGIEALIHDKRCGKNGRRMIPFYDAETTGGFDGHVSSSNTEVRLQGYIDAGDWFEGRETAAIRHVGNSMTEFPDGCILALREVRERRLLIPGENYVIETDEYRITKRFQKGSSPDTIALYSSNQETYPDGRLIYEPFEVSVSDIRRIYSILGIIVNLSGRAILMRPQTNHK
ncbi:MAG: S24 family peptidase [Lachnospiraceae bacterium]|nr:S24 family peptidase [Lachnospiraceae bacterium]